MARPCAAHHYPKRTCAYKWRICVLKSNTHRGGGTSSNLATPPPLHSREGMAVSSESCDDSIVTEDMAAQKRKDDADEALAAQTAPVRLLAVRAEPSRSRSRSRRSRDMAGRLKQEQEQTQSRAKAKNGGAADLLRCSGCGREAAKRKKAGQKSSRQ